MKFKVMSVILSIFVSGMFAETLILKSSEISLDGKSVGKVEVLTPVEVVSDGATAKIMIKGVVAESYQGQIQKSMKNGEIYAVFNEPSDKYFKKVKKLEDDYGEIWYEVEGVYEVSKDVVTKDSDTLYNKAKHLYEESCSPCHRVHSPNEFTASQWPASVQGMVEAGFIAIEEADLNLIIKYLQHNAKESE